MQDCDTENSMQITQVTDLYMKPEFSFKHFAWIIKIKNAKENILLKDQRWFFLIRCQLDEESFNSIANQYCYNKTKFTFTSKKKAQIFIDSINALEVSKKLCSI